MMKLKKCFLASILGCSLVTSCHTAVAQVEEPSKHYLQINGASYHFQRRDLNEFNRGVGYEFRHRDLWGFMVGYDVNSFNRDSVYAAATKRMVLSQQGSSSLSLTGALGAATNYPGWSGINRGSTKLVGLVGVSYDHSSGWGFNLAGIPIRDGLVMFNITYRID